MARILGVIRLSRETETTTSPERQREIVTAWCNMHGHEIVGWAEDIGVSATVDPWQRPSLGPWLRGERGEFDGLVAWRIDRVARRTIHFARLLEWLQERKKTFASATEGFDLSTPMGRVIASIIAALAEGELEAIRDRAKSTTDHLLRAGRWKGGTAPFGYKPVPRQDGPGWTLAIDEDAAAELRAAVQRVIEGESVQAIADDWTRRGVLTSTNRQRLRAGKPLGPNVWHARTVSVILRSEAMLGYVTRRDGSPILDETGLRIQRAEPIVDRKTYAKLQKVLDERSRPKIQLRRNSSLLAGVAFCGLCNQPLHHQHNAPRGNRDVLRYYRCRSLYEQWGPRCGNRSIRAEWLEGFVIEQFLEKMGNAPVKIQRFVPGESHRGEIEAAEADLKRLAERLGQVPEGPAMDAVLARMEALSTQLEKLRSLPEIPDRYEEVETGQTFGDLWAHVDPGEHGDFLRNAGVRAYVIRDDSGTHVEMRYGGSRG